MSSTAEDSDIFRSHLAEFTRTSGGRGPAWLRRLRRDAMDRYAELGLPTSRNEAWKHTSLAPVKRVAFQLPRQNGTALTAEQLDQVSQASLEGIRLVFVNGRYAPELSRAAGLPDGVRAGSLAAAIESDPSFLKRHLARYAPYDNHGFSALNVALFTDGALVYLPRAAAVEAPIQLLYVSSGSGPPAAVHVRNLVVAGQESRAQIVETYLGLGTAPHLNNVVTEIVLAAGARIDHVKIQQESAAACHFSSFQATISRGGRLNSHAVSLGARLARNDVNAFLGGENIECTLNGLYVVSGQQHVDTCMRVDHAKPHCTSHELYKGILDERASGAFRGLIHVHPGAQKTDAYQANRNLLLSDQATVYTDPQLEIYADDVKCSHGATIGRLDEDALFYLRSRGISQAEARTILVSTFADEIVEQIPIEPIRKALKQEIWARLRANS